MPVEKFTPTRMQTRAKKWARESSPSPCQPDPEGPCTELSRQPPADLNSGETISTEQANVTLPLIPQSFI